MRPVIRAIHRWKGRDIARVSALYDVVFVDVWAANIGHITIRLSTNLYKICTYINDHNCVIQVLDRGCKAQEYLIGISAIYCC